MNARQTTMAKAQDLAETWYELDAAGQIVGRFAARVATLLRGKHLPNFTPHADHKIHVIIKNADKAVFTGDKLVSKKYYWHSRYRTGLKSETAGALLERRPEEVLRRAIHGMLPKNRLGSVMDRHVRIYKSGEYTGQHAAQQPQVIDIQTRETV
ncbi:MAG: 50S ribosomal protein L13 [Candidatus Sumerlaeia bacterium]|nr:50S ribosomal protein L13 [Candidatus Sumerlaeia bacterium]